MITSQTSKGGKGTKRNEVDQQEDQDSKSLNHEHAREEKLKQTVLQTKPQISKIIIIHFH